MLYLSLKTVAVTSRVLKSVATVVLLCSYLLLQLEQTPITLNRLHYSSS